MTANWNEFLTWCQAHILCDICDVNFGRRRQLPDRRVFICPGCEKFLAAGAPDQPQLFRSIPGDEESPETL